MSLAPLVCPYHTSIVCLFPSFVAPPLTCALLTQTPGGERFVLDVIRQLMREFVHNNQLGQQSLSDLKGSGNDLRRRLPDRVQLLVSCIRFITYLCEDHESHMQRLLLEFSTHAGPLNFVQEVIDVAVVLCLKLHATPPLVLGDEQDGLHHPNGSVNERATLAADSVAVALEILQV